MDSKEIFIVGETPVDCHFSLENFTYIRAYHGCRPIDVETYQVNGIQPISYEKAKQELLYRLKGSRIPEARQLIVFEKHWANLSDVHKGVWFTLTREELLEESGHYLIAGSEFLLSIATELFCHYDLRRTGIPTIFHCNVPIRLISQFWIDALQNAIINKRFSPCGFKISSDLPSEYIIKPEYPKKIKDPHNRYCTYWVK